MKKIAAEHPALAEHLTATIRTGTICSYALGRREHVRWES